MYGPFMHGYGGSFFGVFGALMMLVFWVLIIIGIVLLVKYVGKSSAGMQVHPGGQSAIDMLKMRYAKGEIDKKEFDEKKKDLGG